MSLQQRKDLIENYRVKEHPRVKRDEESYREMYEDTYEDLVKAIESYKEVAFVRSIRSRRRLDAIEHHIKRYQRYCISEKIGSHYHQKGVSLLSKDVTVEHVIPAKVIRDMLLEGLITIDQALNSPICRVSKKFDSALRNSGLVKLTPNSWFFFSRYATAAKTLGISVPEFETFNGNLIDLETWSLTDHYRFFNVSVE